MFGSNQPDALHKASTRHDDTYETGVHVMGWIHAGHLLSTAIPA